MADQAETAGRQSGSLGRLVIPLGVALAVSGAVYLLTQVITLDINTSLFGQSAADTFSLKSWLASGVLAFAAFQLYSALWIYGRLPGRRPRWLGLAGAAGVDRFTCHTVRAVGRHDSHPDRRRGLGVAVAVEDGLAARSNVDIDDHRSMVAEA